MPPGRTRDPFCHPEWIFESTAKTGPSTPAPMLNLMPHQSPFRLVHLVFETSRLFFVPIRSVETIERIYEPVVPERGDAVFRT